MTEIRARLAPGRSVDVDSFADLTTEPADVSWGDDGRLLVAFDADLPAAVEAAVRHRIMSITSREEFLRGEAEDFLSASDPDLTEIREQVGRLTEIVLGHVSTADPPA